MKLPKPLGETLGEVLLGGAMTVLATQAGWAAPLASTPANPASSPSEDVATTLEASAEAPEESLAVEQQKTAGKASQKSSQNSSAQTSETREPASALEVAQAQPGSFSQLPTPPAFSAPAPMTPSPGAPQPVTPPASVLPPPAPDVLVPNPNVTIDGVPASPAGAIQPVSPAPPFLPRAVAPPVGDIAVSNINANPGGIDLGTGQRVSRLLLRDTSSREVLAILARQAGLNLVFIGGAAPGAQGAPGAAPGATPGGAGGEQDTSPRISLDIENEPVQEVFNYVLRVAGLEANRVGTTIFVGTRLPDEARNVVVRSLRMNQVPVTSAANFLTAQGAETQIPTEQVQIQTIGEGAAARTVEIRTPSILALRANEGNGPLLLRGVSILTDDRLNAITLVGPPRKVEIAVGLLMQLDARRRQVAVNVRIVDVNLLGIDAMNTSFSFGVADSFFSVDAGSANFNYGPSRPPTAVEASGSLSSPTVIGNPYATSNTFLDFDSPGISIPGTEPGSIEVTPGSVIRTRARGTGSFFRRNAGVSGDPFQAGIVDLTATTDNVTTFPATGAPTTVLGQPATATAALPSLFQFPRRFLASLQAQIQSGNAKILTDPTLIVQEGQSATIRLTQDVITNVSVERESTSAGTVQTTEFETEDAGLILGLVVQRIDDNGFVTLAVNPSVTSPVETRNTGGGGSITLLSRRELSSGQIRMRDGQTLILAGIIQDSERTTVSKVPILGDIPLLGALFRSTNRQNQRQEVIVLVTPQIMDDSGRSTFGYSYTPSPQTREVLQRGGFSVPR